MYLDVLCPWAEEYVSLDPLLDEDWKYEAFAERTDETSERYFIWKWSCLIKYWASYKWFEMHWESTKKFPTCPHWSAEIELENQEWETFVFQMWEMISIQEWEIISLPQWWTVSVQEWETILVYEWDNILVQEWETIFIHDGETVLVQDGKVMLIQEWEQLIIQEWWEVLVQWWEILLVQDEEFVLVWLWETIAVPHGGIIFIQDWVTILLPVWEILPVHVSELIGASSSVSRKSSWWSLSTTHWWLPSVISQTWMPLEIKEGDMLTIEQFEQVVLWDEKFIIEILSRKEESLLKDPSFYERVFSNEWHQTAFETLFNSKLPESLYKTWWN